MWGTHPLASATYLRRSQTLPPSEMKSLYGSITTSPVSSLLYVTTVMLPRTPSVPVAFSGPHRHPIDEPVAQHEGVKKHGAHVSGESRKEEEGKDPMAFPQ